MTRRYPMSKNILRYLLLFHKFTKTIAGRGINDIINSGRQSWYIITKWKYFYCEVRNFISGRIDYLESISRIAFANNYIIIAWIRIGLVQYFNFVAFLFVFA